MTTDTRCGHIAIVGPPNAGKSTLLNRLLGQKLAAVSPRAQTTRSRLLGILTEGDSQLVFTDTPGIFTPKKVEGERAKVSDRTMLRAAWDGAEGADLILLMLDAAEKAPLKRHADLIEALQKKQKDDGEQQRPFFVALNKVDLISPEKLLPLAAQLQALFAPQAIFMIEAATGKGCEPMVKALGAALPQRAFEYDADEVTTAPLRDLAAEFTREQLFLQLRHEIPYDCEVTTDGWEAFENGSVKVTQTITVAKDSQKAIVIGKGGAQLKALGAAARGQIAELAGAPVHLFLHVKLARSGREG